MDRLTPKMQERLDKWMKNTLPVKSVEKILGKPLRSVGRQVRGDHGDEIKEEELRKTNEPR